MYKSLLVLLGVSLLIDAKLIRDNKKEVVLDTNTNLMWQDDKDIIKEVKKIWLLAPKNIRKCEGKYEKKDEKKCFDTSGDTADTYCKKLTLGGYKDWRLPTINELTTIVDKNNSPTINSAFKNKSGDLYWFLWSISTNPKKQNEALAIDFDTGDIVSFTKATMFYIRCVRDNK